MAWPFLLTSTNIEGMYKLKVLFFSLFSFALLICLSAATVNVYVTSETSQLIKEDARTVKPAYTAILLGSLVFPSGNLSRVMQLRADKAIELYNAGTVKRILVSGDHGTKEYDEVNGIKNYLEKHGVPKQDIFLDHAGFNTYDSMVRAKEVFKVDDAVIVTQEFHLARALYIADRIGISAEGIIAENPERMNVQRFVVREKLARVKSFAEVQLGLDPTYLGPEIPIDGNSALTFDQ